MNIISLFNTIDLKNLDLYKELRTVRQTSPNNKNEAFWLDENLYSH